MSKINEELLRERFEDSMPDLLEKHEEQLRDEFEDQLKELEDEEDEEEDA